MMTLSTGQRIEVVGRNPSREWYQIIVPGSPSERGWVSQDLLALEGDINTVPEVRE
jgi:hypothetical protein